MGKKKKGLGDIPKPKFECKYPPKIKWPWEEDRKNNHKEEQPPPPPPPADNGEEEAKKEAERKQREAEQKRKDDAAAEQKRKDDAAEQKRKDDAAAEQKRKDDAAEQKRKDDAVAEQKRKDDAAAEQKRIKDEIDAAEKAELEEQELLKHEREELDKIPAVVNDNTVVETKDTDFKSDAVAAENSDNQNILLIEEESDEKLLQGSSLDEGKLQENSKSNALEEDVETENRTKQISHEEEAKVAQEKLEQKLRIAGAVLVTAATIPTLIFSAKKGADAYTRTQKISEERAQNKQRLAAVIAASKRLAEIEKLVSDAMPDVDVARREELKTELLGIQALIIEVCPEHEGVNLRLNNLIKLLAIDVHATNIKSPKLSNVA